MKPNDPSPNPIRCRVRVREVVERDVELTPADIALVRSWMADALISHIQYHDYRSCYQGATNLAHIEFCKRFGVDPEIDADRVEFFKAVVAEVVA
jgi:hypothetical protein